MKKYTYNTYSCAIFFLFYLPSFIHSFHRVNRVRWHQIATGHFFLLLKMFLLVLFILSGLNNVNTVKTHKSSNYVICQRACKKGILQWQWFPDPQEFYALPLAHTVWLLPHGFVNPRFVTAEGMQVWAGGVVNKKK